MLRLHESRLEQAQPGSVWHTDTHASGTNRLDQVQGSMLVWDANTADFPPLFYRQLNKCVQERGKEKWNVSYIPNLSHLRNLYL